eukprot:GFYU01001045.1.p1 GENE.GFYU01001045.1~~GFYU01001045.1.p1  ORF type:complete len:331 (+),score=121.90 GFYU01001045.1:46-1038(+)
MSKAPVRVLITGAAGQIGYSLAPLVARGYMLGPDQPVILHLLDIPVAEKALGGVVFELQDGAYELLHGVVATSDVEVAFKDIDYALLVGAFPRRKGMERKDLLEKNVAIFKQQGEALNNFAKKSVKVLVVGNPANTNCLICSKYAPSIPKENFTAMTRLDHNRARAQIALKAGTPVANVKNVCIWGNHSSTQFPDPSIGTVGGKPVGEVVTDKAWIEGEFVETVRKRGAAIIEARQLSSAMSAANAAVEHFRDWVLGTAPGEYVSMAVLSDGNEYGIQGNLIYSFPVKCSGGKWEIVQGLEIGSFARSKLQETEGELAEERDMALEIIGA